MKIHFIFSAFIQEGKLYIGHENKLLISLKKDMSFFKNTTCGNTVLMGYNTWRSMNFKLLNNRINLILTNKKEFLSEYDEVKSEIQNYYKLEKLRTVFYFVDYRMFKKLVKSLTYDIFIIGGAKVIQTIISDKSLKRYMDKLYLTQINNLNLKITPDTFLDIEILKKFKNIGYSQIYQQNSISFRIMIYQYY